MNATKCLGRRRILTVFFSASIIICAQAQWATDPAVNNTVSAATDSQKNARSISDGNGGVIIVWEDRRTGFFDIYAQRINASGVALWTANGVAVSAAGDSQQNPAIVPDGSGGAIITWQDSRSLSAYDIYAQRINASGVVQWATDGVVVCTGVNDQRNPILASVSTGGAIIAWEDFRSGTNFDIYAQYINGSGTSVWTANGSSVSSAANAQLYPGIVLVGVVEPIFTWEDARGTNTDIYAQKMNASGTAQWTADGVVVSSSTGSQTKPAITFDGSSGAIITWADDRFGATDIFAQRINSSGAQQWTANGVVVSSTTGIQANPKILPSTSGSAIIAWEDFRNGTNFDLYAQRVNSSGVVQWTNNGVAITSAANAQSNPGLTYDNNSLGQGAFIVWADSRTGNLESNLNIHAQRVNLSGILCGNVSTPGTITGTQTILAGSSNTYSVAAVVGATSYTWTLPSGWTGTSTTNSITAIASSTSGNVSVSASNTCGPSIGSSSLAITVNKQNQTITFNALSAKAMGDAAFNLTATATSALPVTYASSNTAVATINGSTVTLVGAGTTTITASQAGNDIFNAAPNVLRDLVVNKGNQTITFATLPSKALGDAPFALTATSSSGLAIEYSSSNTSSATVSGNTVTLLAPGSVTINANQTGNANYNAATQVSQTFCVNPAKPTITASQVNTETPTLTSSSAVGNQWFLNDAAITGATNATLAVAAAGIYKVQVTAGGCSSAFSDNYTFVITGDDSFTLSKMGFSVYPNPSHDRLTVSLPNDYQNKEVSVYTINGQRADFKETYGEEVQFDVAGYSPGIYLIRISSARNNGIIRFTKQ